jgi:hypothetical protein
LSGLMKIATPSAYMEVLHLAAGRGMIVRTLCYVAMSSRRCSGSMARMTNMGDRGSPCWTALLWLKVAPTVHLVALLTRWYGIGWTHTRAMAVQNLVPARP